MSCRRHFPTSRSWCRACTAAKVAHADVRAVRQALQRVRYVDWRGQQELPLLPALGGAEVDGVSVTTPPAAEPLPEPAKLVE